MKTIWKVLIGAAAVAAVTPYKVEKDEESGAVKVTSVTWAVTVRKSGADTNVTLNLLPLLAKKAEDGCESADDGCACGDGACESADGACCCGGETEAEGGDAGEEPDAPASGTFAENA